MITIKSLQLLLIELVEILNYSKTVALQLMEEMKNDICHQMMPH